MEGKKILVVDDQKVNVLMLKAHLEKKGFAVLEALDGYKALEITSKESPDLVLLDIMMPGLSGFDVCREISSGKTSATPVILLTALASQEDVNKGFEVGAFDYVKKPFNFKELFHRMNSALKYSESVKIVEELKKLSFSLKNNGEKPTRCEEQLLRKIEELEQLAKDRSSLELLNLRLKEIRSDLKRFGKKLSGFRRLLEKAENFGQN